MVMVWNVEPKCWPHIQRHLIISCIIYKYPHSPPSSIAHFHHHANRQPFHDAAQFESPGRIFRPLPDFLHRLGRRLPRALYSTTPASELRSVPTVTSAPTTPASHPQPHRPRLQLQPAHHRSRRHGPRRRYLLLTWRQDPPPPRGRERRQGATACELPPAPVHDGGFGAGAVAQRRRRG